MRWIAGLAAIAVLAGCFESRLVYCDNGAICPASFACTEREGTACGEAENVAPCKTAPDRTGCTSSLMPVGTCMSGVCSECTADFLECRFPEWRAMDAPSVPRLNALWVGADDNVYAVGDAGTVLHYNGTSWMLQPGPSTETLVGIWGSGDELVVIAGSGNAYHYAGGTWQTIPPLLDQFSSPVSLLGVWGADLANVFAVGNSSTIGQLSGASWQKMTSNDASMRGLSAISGASAMNIYAVGTGGVVLHYNGSNWMVDAGSASLAGDVFLGVSAHASGRVIAVGYQGSNAVIASKEAMGWNTQTAGTARLIGAWVRDNGDAFAVGTGGYITHFDGAAWAMMPSPTTNDLTAIAGTAMNVYAVGATGTILRYAK